MTGLFTLAGLYMLLHVVQALLISSVDEQMRAERLLIDILRFILSLVWGSIVVSRTWDVNLGSLLAAMGVGSTALAQHMTGTSRQAVPKLIRPSPPLAEALAEIERTLQNIHQIEGTSFIRPCR